MRKKTVIKFTNEQTEELIAEVIELIRETRIYVGVDNFIRIVR